MFFAGKRIIFRLCTPTFSSCDGRPLSLTLYYTGAKFCAYMAGTSVNSSDHYEDFVMDSRIIRRGKPKYVEPGAPFLVLI